MRVEAADDPGHPGVESITPGVGQEYR